MRSILFIAALAFMGCTANQATVSQTPSNSTPTPSSERPQSVTAHSSENQPQAEAQPTPETQGSRKEQTNHASGDPIDTTKFDKAINQAAQAFKNLGGNETSKKGMAQAYFDRGFALTQARQYAAALGDYRMALKLDPTHAESKKWVDQILSIYSSLKREPPKEGEEPDPLPFKKQAEN